MLREGAGGAALSLPSRTGVLAARTVSKREVLIPPARWNMSAVISVPANG
jgi:hypothetical protein